MSSILLSSFVTDSVYNSDMEKKMKSIEIEQIKQINSQPEYLKQFDDLSFDNISDPTSVNDAYSTVGGMSSSLQRDLDFKAGYSNFQENDMHYDVVTRDKFTHNNMVPTTARRDFSVDPRKTQRKLETYTGNFSDYTPKKEKLPLFEPMSDLTFPNGMPNVTDKMANRYIPSNKNNNANLPFENNVRVRPGLDNANQGGNYAVYRVLPRNIDALRSDINQKITYDNKPLETIKKGEMRGTDFNLTKFKLPDYREQKVGDLVATRSNVEGTYNVGNFTNVMTTRNTSENYQPGPGVNTSRGDGPDKNKTKFQAAKKETFMNDNTRGVNAEVKLVMTNAKSYTNVETQRASTNIQYEAPANMSTTGNYAINYKDVPLTTLRELMISNENVGFSGVQEKNSYVFSNDMVLPVTNRQTMTERVPVLGPNTEVKQGSIKFADKAKDTMRQFTSHNMAINANVQEKMAPVQFTDNMKDTMRQTTSYNMAINANVQEKMAPVQFTDNMKDTIRQSTSHNIAINANVQDKMAPVQFTDNMKDTIRQSTSHNIAINANVQDKMAPVHYTDNMKPTIRQSTSHNMAINANIQEKMAPVQFTDNMKDTIRQSTSHNMAINANVQDKMAPVQFTDNMKDTIRQSTSHNIALNFTSQDKNVPVNISDKMKPTIRQSTSHNMTTNVNNMNMGNYSLDTTDIARRTIKETTMLENYNGVATGEINRPTSHDAVENMEIDERREITTYNRAANGKADLNGPYIDRDNVHLNDPVLYSYTPAPHKMLDFSVMPTVTRDVIENVYARSKPIIDTSSYYINSNFINTLKNNPLVNDIYHQKNV